MVFSAALGKKFGAVARLTRVVACGVHERRGTEVVSGAMD